MEPSEPVWLSTPVLSMPLRRCCQTRIVADRRACLAKPVDAVVHRSPQIVCARRETSNGAESDDGGSANRGDRDDRAFRRHVCLWRCGLPEAMLPTGAFAMFGFGPIGLSKIARRAP
jgi:hypothetical protein